MRYSGIVHTTGEPDTGKTIFMLQVAHPSKIAFFHDDVKTPPVASDKFGLFVDLVQETKKLKLLQLHDFFLKKIEAIKPNQYEAIIFDTWPRLSLAIRWWAKQHSSDFRELNTFSANGRMKAGEEWNEATRYEAQIISDLSKVIPFVGIVTHLKDVYEGGAKVTGMKQPDISKAFDRICNFRVWLRHNPNSGVPIALVLKRLNESTITEKGLEIVNILPWKITPHSEDGSVWDTIDRYRKEPFGNRSPSQEETPDNFEFSILTGIMTKEQRQIWQANLKEKEILEREELLLVSEEDTKINERIKALFSEGMSIVAVTQAINNEFQTKFDFAEINRRKE